VKFECRKASNRSAINRLVGKFETTENVINNKTGVVSKKSVKTPENIHNVEQALTQSPNKSVKYLFQQLSLGASSTYRII
jgi:hypothetical protein